MENIEISIDIIRVQTLMRAIHRDRLKNDQLNRLTRYLFSDEFVEEFIILETSPGTDQEKQKEFEDIYRRSITQLELLN